MTFFRLFPALAALLTLVLASCHRETAQPSTNAKAYPLNVCLISGEKLGNHGDPYVFTRDGQEVKLCCESCLEEFNTNAGKLLKQLADGKAAP